MRMRAAAESVLGLGIDGRRMRTAKAALHEWEEIETKNAERLS